jgi:hypothetical protein
MSTINKTMAELNEMVSKPFHEYVPTKSSDVFDRARTSDAKWFKPDPDRHWFVVPTTEKYGKTMVVNRNGDEVGEFNEIDEAIELVKIWNEKEGF